MNRTQLARIIGGLGILFAVLGFGLVAQVAAAGTPPDLRGDWAASTKSGTSTYPQTLHITSENFATGQISGTDTSPDGTSFVLTGQISGTSVTLSISNTSYQSTTHATIAGVAPALTLSGSFTDSDKRSGTLTASLTTPAAISPPTSAAASDTPAPGATLAASGATVAAIATNTSPADPGSPNELPLVALGAVALLAAGLGVAAYAGLVPGIGGAASGSGAGEVGSGGGSSQQTARPKIQQDTSTSIMPTMPDAPIRPASPGLDPGLDSPAPERQQTERHMIMQDVRTSISPTMPDYSANINKHQDFPRPGRLDNGMELPAQNAPAANPPAAPAETIGPASAMPNEGPPAV